MNDRVERTTYEALDAIGSVQDYAIFLLDPRGHVLTWNEGARLSKGYEAEEIVGRSFTCFYTEEDRAAGEPARLLRLAEEHGRTESEGYRIRKDGTRFWADVVITRLRDRAGGLAGFIKVTRDLTERKAREDAIRASAESFRLMIESAKEYAIFTLDADGFVSSWNAGARRLKQYEAHEIVGKHVSTFYSETDCAIGKPSAMLAMASERGWVEDQGFRVRKDGSRFFADVIVSAVRDDRDVLLGFTKVTRDMSEMLRMQRALSEEQERTAVAQRTVKHREEFLLVAAHELRTPLTALQLQLEGLQRVLSKSGDTRPFDDGRMAERMSNAVMQGERLGHLIERLLDVSRLVAGQLEMKFEPFDLSELGRSIVNDYCDAALQQGSSLELVAERAVPGVWDHTRLQQVITNLLSNALKYGAGHPIELRIEGTAGGAMLSVSDRGIGIAAEDLERIFDRFERAAPTRNYGGLGLGLYITKRIVEAHGGTIRAHSVLGEGSRFVVTLPNHPLRATPSV
jgi:PAS domain S-box-containing protein